jgi:hypothetical protein
MANRNAFYSFHYLPDNWRASQVRNMGVVDGNHPVSDNDWETVTRGGDAAIERWIDNQMSGRSCVVVLIGGDTASRKWVHYEINKGWNANKGVVGIYIHNLKNAAGLQASRGLNPFDYNTLSRSGAKLSTLVRAYDPPYYDSQQVYAYIKLNIGNWIEEAITIRSRA